MKMPGTPVDYEETWSPTDNPEPTHNGEDRYKPEPIRDDRAPPAETVNPFQKYVDAPGPKAQRFERSHNLGDRFYQHWVNAMYGGTAGIMEAAIIADQPDSEMAQQAMAERRWREMQFENLPEAESPLEYGAAIAGGLFGGFTDAMSLIPIARIGSAGFRTASPVLSRILDQSVSGAAMNAAASSALQGLEIEAGLREDFDPLDTATQAGIGAVAGAGFGTGEGYIARAARDRGILTEGLARAPEPGKATRAPGRPTIEVTTAGQTSSGPVDVEPDSPEVQSFTKWLEDRGMTPEQLDEIEKDQDASLALYNEYLSESAGVAQEAQGRPPSPEGLMETYGPERLNDAQKTLFGEVIGTRNLTPEQMTALQDHLAGTQPATDRASDYAPGGENGGKVDTAPVSAPPMDVPIGPYRQFRPEELKVDAKRFQFKEGGDDAGVTDRLKGVKKWDPTKAGQTLVWEDKDGNFFIADGHQRHGLATRMAAEGQDVRIPAYVLREADGISAEEARVLAAAKNIAEGTGSAVDGAKILRQRPDMEINLPPSSALVRDAVGLAKLSDDAFGMVVNKKVPPAYAALVGKYAPEPGTHAELLAMLAKNEPENAIEAESMVRDALEAPAVQSTMEDMFGSSTVTQILFKERAQILSAAAKAIRKDRAAFQTLVREEERISGAGNRLATATNQERAAQDAALLATIQAAARRKGPIADALAVAAKRLKDGESRSAVVRDFIEAVRQEARSIGPGGGRTGGAGQGEQVAASGVRRNTDSAAFQKWFGDSKVVDEKGEPLVVYHGTDQAFDQFKPGEGRAAAIGRPGLTKGQIYLTTSEKHAAQFGSAQMPLYASIKNPHTVDAVALLEDWRLDPQMADEAGKPRFPTVQAMIDGFYNGDAYAAVNADDLFSDAAKQARASGNDGAIVDFGNLRQDRAPLGKVIIAFEPTQIKSVFNRGTFDPADPRIAFSGQMPSGRTADPLLSDFPPGYHFIEGKGLIKGHWAVADESGRAVWNYEPTKEAAVAQAKQRLANLAANQRAESERLARVGQIRDKLTAGAELTDGDLAALNLKTSAGFPYLSKVVQEMFGISRAKVREAMGDAIKVGHTDMGAERHFANARKALANAAAYAKEKGIAPSRQMPSGRQMGDLFEAGAEGKPQAVIPGAERISDKALAERQGAGKMRSSKAQKDMDFGLFGAERDQLDLVDLAQSKIAPMARDDAEYLDFSPSAQSRSIQIGDTSIVYAPKDGEVEIISVRTPPQLRNQGRAREALMAFLDRADEAGLKVRAMSTPLDRATDPAGVIRFYQSLGFTPTGRRVNKAGDIEMLRQGPPPELSELRSLVGSGQLIPLADYTDPRTRKSVEKAFTGTQPARSFDDIYSGRAERWQSQLGVEGERIAQATGARLENKGIKKRATAEAKIGRKGYKSTSELTDIVRMGFMVDHPDQAQRIINMLAQRWRVLDNGWVIYPGGYFDRKANIQFPDGTIGEVQFWEPSILAAKKGAGRELPPGDPKRVEIEQQMWDFYGDVISALDPSWAATVGRASGKSGNVLENIIRMSSSEGSSTPESRTSMESAGSQADPSLGTNQAKPPSMAAGRPSQSKNRMGGGIAAKTRPPQQPVPTNRAQSGTTGPATGAERLEDIADDLKRLVGLATPVRQGRLARFRDASGKPMKVAGQYDRDQGVIRMAEMSDFETRVHETAHALETEYGRDLDALVTQHAAEVEPLAYPGATNLKSEGFAEFMRFYVSNPQYTQRQAPAFFQAFETFLQQRNPKQLAGLRDIQRRYVDWQFTPSQAVIAADIVSARKHGTISDSISEMRREGIGTTLGKYFDKLYTRTMDKTHPIAKLVDELKKVHEQKTGKTLDLIAAQDPSKLARLFPDAQAQGHMDLMHGVKRYGSVVRDGPGLADALEVALGRQWQNWSDDQLTEFAAYLVSRRALQEYDRFWTGELPNVPGKFTQGDYQVARDEFEAAHPEWAQAAEMVYEWGRNMLAKKADAGFISQETFRELVQREDYVPFMRDLTDLDKEVLAEGGGARTLKHNLLKRFRGSKRSVINPIESMAKDAYDTNVLIAANDIAKSIDDLARMVGVGAGQFVERIPDKELKKAADVDAVDILRQAAKEKGLNPNDIDQLTTMVGNLLGDASEQSVFRWTDTNEKGEPIIYVWRDGKRSALRLADGDFGKEVYQSLTGLNKEMQGMWTAIASLPATALRYGITTAPPFVVANFIRDQVSAWVLTGDGFLPVITGASGLRDELTQNEITRLYNSYGGIMGGSNVAALDRARANRDIRALQKKGYFFKRFASVRGFAELTELTETGTRLGVFKKAFERARRDGLNDHEAAVEAAYTARDLIDFGRHGSRMLAARRLIPFLNASLQGLDKTVRTTITPWVKLRSGRPLSAQDKRNLGTSAKAWGKMTAMGLASAGLAYLYRDDPEYEEISDQLKATNWLVKMGDGKWAVIPKPYELGIVANMFERTFDAVYKKDPTAMARFMDGMYEVTAPPFIGGMLKGDVGRALKDIPAIGTFAEIKANKDFETGRPIIPDGDLGLEPAMQYTAYTSDLARKLGEAVNVSPAVIDHAISGFGGSWGNIIQRYSTDVADEQGLLESTANSMERRFIRDAYRGGTSSRAFWNLVGESTGTMARVSESYKKQLDRAGQAKASEYLDRMDEDEKAYALLNAHFEAEAKRLHPLRRAQDAINTISEMRKQIAGNDLFHIEDKDVPVDERETIPLTPNQRQGVQDILARIQMVEARNALITLQMPGWAQRKPMDLDSLNAELAEAYPQIADELLTRFEKAKVYDAAAVAESWPDVKERILTDRQDADFGDLISGAK